MTPADTISLVEHTPAYFDLSHEDFEFLNKLGFELSAVPSKGTAADAKPLVSINPKQFVGNVKLPSGRIVVVAPKIGTAAVIRMLAYVYGLRVEDLLMDGEVKYAADTFLFEPLVRLFNELVGNRLLRGLLQDHRELEEDLSVVKGRIELERHLSRNSARPGLIYCRFSESSIDTEENRVVKRTLWHLLRFDGWSENTLQQLRANMHRFTGVDLECSRRKMPSRWNYNRLNDDYRRIHQLCNLFLDTCSISSQLGPFEFRGFIIDMNRLFESFVEHAFLSVELPLGMRVRAQAPESLASAESFHVQVRPDITVSLQRKTVGVVDCKYKSQAFAPENADVYQMLAYATALKTNRTYLVYPEGETPTFPSMQIKNSDIQVRVRTVPLKSEHCTQLVEAAVTAIVQELLAVSA